MFKPTPKQSAVALVALALSGTAVASASSSAPAAGIPGVGVIPILGGLSGLLPPSLPIKIPIFPPPARSTVVTSCNQTVTTNAVLNADLTCVQPASGSLDGIIVGANAITINLNHHTITAPPSFNSGTGQGVASSSANGAGVLSIGFSNSTIENGTLTGWQTGVRLRAIEARAATSTTPAVAAAPNAGNTITGITVPDCQVPPLATSISRGIDIAEPGSDDNVVTNVSVTGPNCGQGIRVHEAQGNTVKASTFRVGAATTTGDGIVIDCGGSNALLNNAVSSNARNGVLIGQADHNDIENNTIGSNGSTGVFFGPPLSGECSPATSSHNTVANNQINANHGSGIAVGPSVSPKALVANSGDNDIESNTIASNALDGIALEDTDNNAVANKIVGNLVDGILVDTSSADDTLTRNAVSSNQTNGTVVNGQGSVLSANSAMSNKGDGFLIAGSATNPATGCDSSNCANRLQGNLATGNAAGGIVVAADNADLGGNVGANNGVSGQNCIFGATPCMP